MNARVFWDSMTSRGCWKYSGRTNRSYDNVQRMWVALGMLIGAVVTLVTLGNVTCWADIKMSLSFAATMDEFLDEFLKGSK